MPENEEIPLGGDNGDRRFEKRHLINAQIEISGIDYAGNSFTGLTKVKNFSDVGCHFQTQIRLRCGSTISIEPLAPDGQRLPQEPSKLFKIVWTSRCENGWRVGARVFSGDGISDRESASANPTSGNPAK